MDRRKFIEKSVGFCGYFGFLSSHNLFAETSSQALSFNFLNQTLSGEIQWIRRNQNERNMSLVSLLNFGDKILHSDPESKNHSAFTYREDHGALFLSNHRNGNIHWILFYEEAQINSGIRAQLHFVRLDEKNGQFYYESSFLIDNSHDSSFPINSSYGLMALA